jgi:hypothetical protein
VARLDVPEGTSPQQVEAFVFEKLNAGGTQAQPDAPNALERLGRGFEDVRQGVKQVGTMIGEKAASLALGEKTVNQDSSARRKLTASRPRSSRSTTRGAARTLGMDWMRLAGNVLGTAPISMVGGGATGLLTRSAVGAGQGAAASAAMYTPEHESKLKQTLIGGGFGAAMPIVLQGVKLAYGGMKDKLASYSLDPAKNPALAKALSQDVQVALEQKGIDFNRLTQEVRDQLVNEAGASLQAGGKLDATRSRAKPTSRRWARSRRAPPCLARRRTGASSRTRVASMLVSVRRSRGARRKTRRP